MKRLSVLAISMAAGLSLSCGSPDVSAAKEIIHDGEYNFIKAQHGEKLAKEDVVIERIV